MNRSKSSAAEGEERAALMRRLFQLCGIEMMWQRRMKAGLADDFSPTRADVEMVIERPMLWTDAERQRQVNLFRDADIAWENRNR